jgi:hypothetical protein
MVYAQLQRGDDALPAGIRRANSMLGLAAY